MFPQELIYVYDASNKKLLQSSKFVLNLRQGITAAEAQEEATPIISRLVHIMKKLKEAMRGLPVVKRAIV